MRALGVLEVIKSGFSQFKQEREIIECDWAS